MKWPNYHLGKICDVNWGNTSITKKSYTKDGFDAFSAAGQDGRISHYEHEGDGIVLSAIGAKCGKCFRAIDKWTAIKNTITIKAFSSKHIDIGYMFYYLNQKNVWPRRGAGQPFIALGDARKLSIPVPPPSEQRQIVEILDQADRLRKLRADADTKFQRILPALFIKMFGDTATNSKGWKTGTLGSVIIETQYGTSARAHKNGEGIPIIRMNNIDYRGFLDLKDLKYVVVSESDQRKFDLEEGDILFNRTNSKELVGKTGLWRGDFKAIPASYLIRVRIDRKQALPEFVWAYMNCSFIKQMLLNKSRRAIGMANINAQELKKLPFIIPALTIQKSFAAQTGKLEALRVQRVNGAKAIDRLFKTILHRAFTGDLTASWRKAHMKELLQEMELQAKALAS